MVEALVPVPDVAEDRRLVEPRGDRRQLLALGLRRLRVDRGRLEFPPHLLVGGVLLIDRLAQLLDLRLRLPELLLEETEPPIGGALRERLAGGAAQQDDREAACDEAPAEMCSPSLLLEPD